MNPKTALLFLLLSVPASAGEYDFEIPGESGSAVPAIALAGNLDARYTLIEPRRSSPLYKLQYYGRDPRGVLSQNRLDLYLGGDHSAERFSFRARTYAQYYGEDENDLALHELYGSLSIGSRSTLTAGKKRYSWGKGYAFNPAGFVNSVKDPENPELAQAGLMSLGYEYIRSFSGGPVSNASFEAVLIPAAETLNAQNSEARDTDLAARLSLLAWDTDLDLTGYASRVNAERAGAGFSRNLGTAVEIHGEYARFFNKPRAAVSNGTVTETEENGEDWLAGFRWLNRWNMTVIAEYYRSGSGLGEGEYGAYRDWLAAAAVSGSSATAASVMSQAKTYFGASNLMRDYLYFKVSVPEPFDWLYFTPSVYLMLNAGDGSWLAGAPLSYKPVNDLEFIAWPVFSGGKRGSEFGDRQAAGKLEFWLRFYF